MPGASFYLFIFFPPHTSFNFFLKTDVETKSQTKLGSPPRAAPPVSGGLAASLVLSLFMLLLAEKGQYTAPFRHREDPTPGSVGRRVFPGRPRSLVSLHWSRWKAGYPSPRGPAPLPVTFASPSVSEEPRPPPQEAAADSVGTPCRSAHWGERCQPHGRPWGGVACCPLTLRPLTLRPLTGEGSERRRDPQTAPRSPCPSRQRRGPRLSKALSKKRGREKTPADERKRQSS